MDKLPIDALSHILSFLSFEDQVRVMTVARDWNIAARVSLKLKTGFVVGTCMGNKPFCEGIRQVHQLDVMTEQGVRMSLYQGHAQGPSWMKSKLSTLCPFVEILCDGSCDQFSTLILLHEYRTRLKYLQLDSVVKHLHTVGEFPSLHYLKCQKLKSCSNIGETFPCLKYLDCNEMTQEQIASLPASLTGLKVYYADRNCIPTICRSAAKESLEALHIITDRATSSVDVFHLPNLKDLSIRGLEDMDGLFASLKRCRHMQKLHVSARTCITVRSEVMLDAFALLTSLTSLNLRFIILKDPTDFWSRMVQIFAHRLHHLTFSTHFVTSESLNIMTGFATLKSFVLTFIYDQPFLFNNVPVRIRNRAPFDVKDLLAFFRAPTASEATLVDIAIHMQSLGSDKQVIHELEAALQSLKQRHCLESAEVKELGNRNSIYI